MIDQITLAHGNGGRLMQELISGLFVKYFDNSILANQGDSAILPAEKDSLAFTTDSFVIDPIFFPGGDIGKLAVCGTVNDLAVSGAKPLYLSASFILEEGFPLKDLEKIIQSIAAETKRAKVLIVTGDTKVVSRGQADKVFITTTGIGRLPQKNKKISSGSMITPGDRIIINGPVGNHGMAVMLARESFNFRSKIVSDCASLHFLIHNVLSVSSGVKFMRDATRGGVATILYEICKKSGFGVDVDESTVPVDDNVRSICEILGMDPLYVANEGKVIMIASHKEAGKIVNVMKKDPLGKKAAIIGEVTANHPNKAILQTLSGGTRIIDQLIGDQLPRIC
ncbi:MAG: hydrogenase expression/formation protein HypE [Bacteroidota bacterium]